VSFEGALTAENLAALLASTLAVSVQCRIEGNRVSFALGNGQRFRLTVEEIRAGGDALPSHAEEHDRTI
jgi:hypothetical protein